MHCYKISKTKAALSGSLLILVSASLLLYVISTADVAQARYLPTRADTTDTEVLRALIQSLIAEVNKHGFDSKMDQSNVFSERQPYRVDRRSMELPQGSAGDTLIRRMGASAVSED